MGQTWSETAIILALALYCRPAVPAPAPTLSNPEPDFATRVIAWQRQHGRHTLPWQQTRDPYRIWLSEIMLQQTQVAAVLPYYTRFLERFPTLQALAEAPIEAVLEHWAGLGYYARARNLHRCAQQIVERHGGCFPEDPALLAELSGIGRSTAAAIAAFAWGKRAAILDGNVKRVFCRQFGVEGFPGTPRIERELWALAERLLPATGIEAYTQGLMDLGATLCTRSKPQCPRCPLATTCVARATCRQNELPAPKPRKAVPEKCADFVLITDGSGLLLERRPPTGIWGGLLVPPEGKPAEMLKLFGLPAQNATAIAPFSHTFTHFRLHIQPWLCHIERPLLSGSARWEWVSVEALARAALPAPFKALLRHWPLSAAPSPPD